jgi:kynureninase
LVEEVANESSTKIEFITPRDPGRRGCQLSLAIEGTDKNFVQKMMNEGVVMDWRSPGVVRMAPVPMYNSFTDVYLAASALKKILS